MHICKYLYLVSEIKVSLKAQPCHERSVPLCLEVPEEASSHTDKHLTDASLPAATIDALLGSWRPSCQGDPGIGAYSESSLAGSAKSGQVQRAPQQEAKPASPAAAKPALLRLLSFDWHWSYILHCTCVLGWRFTLLFVSTLMRAVLTFRSSIQARAKLHLL